MQVTRKTTRNVVDSSTETDSSSNGAVLDASGIKPYLNLTEEIAQHAAVTPHCDRYQ
jgi:hypothetical protein